MKFTKYHFLIGFSLLIFSCKPKEESRSKLPIVSTEEHDARIKKRVLKAKKFEDSLAKVMHWKPLRDNLYVSKFGDIGFKTAYVIHPPELIETYKTYLCCEEGNPLKDIIDIESFRLIGGDWGFGGYFKDKNHIYHFFGDSGGGNLTIVEDADYPTFEIVNDCYGRDKNHIYDMRFGTMDSIDPGEFKMLSYKDRCLAKYKGTYYWGNHEMRPEYIADDPEMQEAIKLLDKL
jgi:hypothetical protein